MEELMKGTGSRIEGKEGRKGEENGREIRGRKKIEGGEKTGKEVVASSVRSDGHK